MGCLGGATDLGALPRSNHQFQSTGGVLESLNHEILRAFFEKKRSVNAARKAQATAADPETNPSNFDSA
jgi:tRNA(adenine34) deaminase